MIRTKIFHTSPIGNADDKVNQFLDEMAKEHPLTVIMGITHQTVINTNSSPANTKIIDSILVVYNDRSEEEQLDPKPTTTPS